MLPVPSSVKHYRSAHKRFLKPAIESFFRTEFPRSFGENVRAFIADKLIAIFEQNNRGINTIKPGQVLWNAIHKDTRADSHRVKLVPVVLTLINEDDISRLEKGVGIPEHKQNVVARMLNEAYAQDALLSMRDVSLLLAISYSSATTIRKRFEHRHNVTLPHPGNIQDMGSCITHKYQIIYKYEVEKKDPQVVAKETSHTVRAVDNYLRDYHRVKTLALDGKDAQYIHLVTKLSISLINQYLSIVRQYIKEQKMAI